MKSSKKHTYLIAFFFLGMGFLFLVFTSVKSNSMYFLNVSEALLKKEEGLKNARLFGVVGEEVEKNRDGVKFFLLDKDDPLKKIMVHYDGKIPDTFKINSEVIVEGSFSHGVFNAKVLMTKCPSKYKKKS